MNIDKFTIKAQQSIQAAQQLAYNNSNTAIEPVHLLKGILEEDKEVLRFVFQQSGANAERIIQLADSILNSLPTGTANANLYLSPAGNQVLMEANKTASQMGDEFVSIEHLLVALISGKDQ